MKSSEALHIYTVSEGYTAADTKYMGLMSRIMNYAKEQASIFGSKAADAGDLNSFASRMTIQAAANY